MFVNFFYLLREYGIPVTPTSFLRLHKAFSRGIITSIDDFYTGARSLLVKSEKYFDLYDQLFAHHFNGMELREPQENELGELARLMLDEWLDDPDGVSRALGLKKEALTSMSPEEVLQYFIDRLKDQTEEHHGGNRWIGTRGTSPVGHSGYHPGGMRIGGESGHQSAVKTALDRRYRDYAQQGPLTASHMGEALRRLRNMVSAGPKDRVNVDKTIYETMKKAGEIEIVFDRSLKDRLKVVLAVDNGGWSMDPYVAVVQTLFSYARAQFKDLRTFYFHNTIYGQVWEDPRRYAKPFAVHDFVRFDPQTRIIIVGDARMAPYELLGANGSIHFEVRSGPPSIERLSFIAKQFPHAVWLNPVAKELWQYTHTIGCIQKIIPMFELTLEGLEQAVARSMRKN